MSGPVNKKPEEEKEPIKRILGWRIAGAIFDRNVFRVRNMVEILSALPKDTTICGFRNDPKAKTCYMFFNSRKFPEAEGDDIPWLNPQFKVVEKGRNVLTDIGYPDHFRVKRR